MNNIGHCTDHGIDFYDCCPICYKEAEERKKPPPQPGQQWEYCEVSNDLPAIKVINRMGDLGWEFITGNFNINPYRLYFKRPKTNQHEQ